MKLLNEMYSGVGGLDNYDRAIEMINSAVEHHNLNDNFAAIADVEQLVQFLQGQHHDFTPALEQSVRDIIADEMGHEEEEESHKKTWKRSKAQQREWEKAHARDPWLTNKLQNRGFDNAVKGGSYVGTKLKDEEEESLDDKFDRFNKEKEAFWKEQNLRKQRRKYAIHGPSRRSGRVRRRDLGKPRGTFGLEQEETLDDKFARFNKEKEAFWKEQNLRKQRRKYAIHGPSRRSGGVRRRDLGKPRGTFGLEQEEEKGNFKTDWNKEVERFRERRAKHEPENARSGRVSDRIRSRRRNVRTPNPFSVEQEEVTSLSDRRTRRDQFRSDVRRNRRGHRHSDPARRQAQLMARKARPHVGLEQEEKKTNYDMQTTDWNKEVEDFRKRRKTVEPKYARRPSRLIGNRRKSGPASSTFGVRFESFKQFNEMYRDSQHGLTIDLSGPEGNAFVLLGHAKSLARQLDMDADAVVAEMQESDYNHLVDTFEKHFGSVVTLINKPGEATDDDYWDE